MNFHKKYLYNHNLKHSSIDEFHHVSSDIESKLGNTLRMLMNETSAHILAMTGSYFRGDSIAILAPEDEHKFDKILKSEGLFCHKK